MISQKRTFSSRHGLCCCFVLLAAFGVALLFATGCASLKPLSGRAPVKRSVITTGYCHCGVCTGWRRNWRGVPVYAYGSKKGQRKIVGQTASGSQVRRGTIAADTSIYPFGTVIYVPGYGYGVVEDRGAAIKGERLDLYFSSHNKARTWGRQAQEVQVWFPDGKR